MSRRHIARVCFYQVAPSRPPRAKSLRGLAAAAAAGGRYGLGVEINVGSAYCESYVSETAIRDHLRRCATCRGHDQEHGDRNKIARETADEFRLKFVRAQLADPEHRPARLHICRGVPGKRDLRRAKRVRDAVVRRFRDLGYRVYFSDDHGGTVMKPPIKPFQLKAAEDLYEWW